MSLNVMSEALAHSVLCQQTDILVGG